MKQEYTITGMGCTGCVARVKNALTTIKGVVDADIKLGEPQGIITSANPLPLALLQMTLHKVGHYTIRNYKKQDAIA